MKTKLSQHIILMVLIAIHFLFIINQFINLISENVYAPFRFSGINLESQYRAITLLGLVIGVGFLIMGLLLSIIQSNQSEVIYLYRPSTSLIVFASICFITSIFFYANIFSTLEDRNETQGLVRTITSITLLCIGNLSLVSSMILATRLGKVKTT